tara:strand:+ start:536 stop:724 length:189 start_codon:yes stop_codon:yes gene_type:complete
METRNIDSSSKALQKIRVALIDYHNPKKDEYGRNLVMPEKLTAKFVEEVEDIFKRLDFWYQD